MFSIINIYHSFVYDYKHKAVTEMLYLSDDAIRYAVSKCAHTDNYKAVVAFKYMQQKDDVERIIVECLNGNHHYTIRRHYHGFVVSFDNGSVFRSIPASANSRGYRYHLLVADERIDDEIINCVLRPKEILEDIDRRLRQRDQEENTYQESIKDTDYPEVSETDFIKVLGVV